MQGGLLLAQRQDLGCHRAVVMGPVLAGAGCTGAPQGLAQIAAAGVRQKGLHQRRRQGDGIGPVAQPALLGCGPGGIQQEGGQARAVGLGGQLQGVGSLFGQHILGKTGAQDRQFTHQGAVALALLRPQAGTGAGEILVHTVQQPVLLRIQCQLVALRLQGFDPGKQGLIQVGGAVVGRQLRGHVALHRLQFGIGLAGREIVKQQSNSAQQAATFVQRRQGVGKIGWLSQMGNGVDLGAVLRQRDGKCGGKVGGLHAAKGGKAVRRVPGLQ